MVQLLGLFVEEAGSYSRWSSVLETAAPGLSVPRVAADRSVLSPRGVELTAAHRRDLRAAAHDPNGLCRILDELGLGPVVELTEGHDRTLRVELTRPDELAWFTGRVGRADLRLQLHQMWRHDRGRPGRFTDPAEGTCRRSVQWPGASGR